MNIIFNGDEISIPIPGYAVGIKVDGSLISYFMKLKGESLAVALERAVQAGAVPITAASTASLADDFGVADGAHVRKIRVVKKEGSYVIEDAGISLLSELLGVQAPLPAH